MLIILNTENIKKCGVYKITNPSNGNFYIGSAAQTFHRRFLSHRRLLNQNKNPCLFLQRAFNKHKNINFVFEILEICDREECLNKEQYYIDKLNPKYNMCKIAGSTAGKPQTEIQLKNQFEAQRTLKDEQIILMFDLYNKGVKVKKISEIVNCKSYSVSSILNFPKRYIWVKQKYNLHLKNKKNKYKGNFLITKPNGKKIIVNNLTKFGRENKLEPSFLNKCFNKKIKTYKGYLVEKA